MASGWSNSSHWPPTGVGPSYLAPPTPAQSINSRGPSMSMGPPNGGALYSFPLPAQPPFVVELGPPIRRPALLPHPQVRGSSLARPFPDPRQQIRLGQQAPYQPPDIRGGVSSPLRPAHLQVTQQPVLLMSPGAATNTFGSVSGSSSRQNDQQRRRQARISDDSSSGRSGTSRNRTASGVHPRPPTPVSFGSRPSPSRARRMQIRSWSPPFMYDGDFDDDDFDMVYNYRLEYEPFTYDLSDDSDDDMYFIMSRHMGESPPARLKGGFECQFVKPFTSEVQTECSICLSVLREPYLVDCCGYRFCKSCIETVKDDRKPCPLCNKDFKTFPDKQLQRMLNQKDVYCKHKDEGCEWTGELSKLDEHLNLDWEDLDKRLDGCIYSMVTCTHCEKPVPRKDFKLHNIQCSGENYTCEYCNDYSASYRKVTEEHWPECPAHPVECPNGCGDTTLKRRDVNKHVACDCPQTVVQCDLAHFGCNVQLPRVEMTSHIEGGTVDHVSLLTKKVSEARDEMDGLKEEFTDVAFELHCLQEMYDAVLEENDELAEDLERKALEVKERDEEIERLKKKLAILETATHNKLPSSSSSHLAVLTQTPPHSNDTSKAVLISNLPPNVNEQKLKSLFGPFGRVTRVNISKNLDAVIAFEHADSVKKAVAKSKTSGLKLLGCKLSLHESNHLHC